MLRALHGPPNVYLTTRGFSTSAWFGDLGDGIHKGDKNDPRVAVIEVIPDEIRYWIATRGKVGQAVDIAVSAVTGHTAAPGELRTITKAEVCFLLLAGCGGQC